MREVNVRSPRNAAAAAAAAPEAATTPRGRSYERQTNGTRSISRELAARYAENPKAFQVSEKNRRLAAGTQGAIVEATISQGGSKDFDCVAKRPLQKDAAGHPVRDITGRVVIDHTKTTEGAEIHKMITAGTDSSKKSGVIGVIGEADNALLVTKCVATLSDCLPLIRSLENTNPILFYHVIFNILQSLVYALETHEKFEIVHMDLKPANMMLRDADDLFFVMIDYDAATPYTKFLQQLSNTSLCVTPIYLPPEMAARDFSHPKAADVYAAGVMILDLLNLPWPLQDKILKKVEDIGWHDIVQARAKAYNEDETWTLNIDSSEEHDFIKKLMSLAEEMCAIRPENRADLSQIKKGLGELQEELKELQKLSPVADTAVNDFYKSLVEAQDNDAAQGTGTTNSLAGFGAQTPPSVTQTNTAHAATPTSQRRRPPQATPTSGVGVERRPLPACDTPQPPSAGEMATPLGVRRGLFGASPNGTPPSVQPGGQEQVTRVPVPPFPSFDKPPGNSGKP